MDTYLQELASRLVGYDTVSQKSNVEAMAYLGNHLEEHGFQVALQQTEVAGVPKANLIAFAGPPEPDGLILSGHVDTVPFLDQPGWTRDPLTLGVEDERVYGRGTSDMKIFLAQCVAAAAGLDLKRLKRPVVFFCLPRMKKSAVWARNASCPSCPTCWVTSPSPAWPGSASRLRTKVFHTHKGVAVFSISVRGLGGHSSIPETGVNAIAVVGKVINIIGQYQAELRAAPSAEFCRAVPGLSVSDAELRIGARRDGGQYDCRAMARFQVSYRPLPKADPLDCLHEITRRVQALGLG